VGEVVQPDQGNDLCLIAKQFAPQQGRQSPRAWVTQRFSEAIDSLSEILLQAGLLSESRPDRRQCQVTDRSLPCRSLMVIVRVFAESNTCTLVTS
jgi:hypothetical protein